MTFEITDFDELEVGGIYDVFITQDDQFNIEVKGRDRYKKDVLIKKYGDVLEIDMAGRRWDLLKELDDEMRLDVFITLPTLRRINSKGLSHFEIKDFDVDVLDIDLSGASSGEMNLDANELKIYLDGASALELEGESKYMQADVSGASTLKAFDHPSETVEVSTSGASSARVNASRRLSIDANGLSTVRYQGDADVNVINEDELSTVKRSGK